MSVDIKATYWNYDKIFANKFLALFGDKEPRWEYIILKKYVMH